MGHNLTWTVGRQLASFDNISYTYNEDGLRTSKTVNGVTTKYYYDGTKLVKQDSGNNPIIFLYDRNYEVIGLYYNTKTFLFVKNLQGDVTAIIDDEGFLVARYIYDDWGNCTVIANGQTWNDVANVNPIRYRSYYYDSDIQMYYLQSRYYDADVGRFINCDDVNYIGLTESEISYNPFAYCENNPVNDSDPSGNIRWRLTWKWTAAMGVLFTLARVLGMSLDIRGIHSVTKNKIHTALTTAVVYSQFYVSAEIISYVSKTSFAISMLSTIINLIIFMITGPSGSIVKNILLLVASYFVPGLATSIKMIYRGLKLHRGCSISIGRYGTSVIM